MVKTTRLKLSWICTFLLISYFSAFGMDFMETGYYMQRECDDTFQEFCNVIKIGSQHIKIKIERKHWHEYDPSGIYQSIPYYVKVLPEDIETSRFIIQKQPFNDEWQLTEIYDKIWRRTIYPFPSAREETNESSGKIIVESFDLLQKEIKIMKENILNLETEIMLKNKTITQINKFLTFSEETIVAKENQIHNLNYKIHFQKFIFAEKIRLIKIVHFVKMKQKYYKKEEKLQKEFEKKIEELKIPNNSLELKFEDLKLRNDNWKMTKENQIQNLQSKIDFQKKILTSVQVKIQNSQAKVKELEIANKKLKLEITDLKSTNHDLNHQSKHLNQEICSLHTQNDCFCKEKTNLAQKLDEEHVEIKTLEFSLHKEKSNQESSEQFQSQNKSKREKQMNSFAEPKNNTVPYALNQYSPNEIHANLKPFVAKLKKSNEHSKSKKVEKLLEKTNDDIKIEKILEQKNKTNTKADNNEKIQTLDSAKQKNQKQIGISQDMLNKKNQTQLHENISEQNLAQNISNGPETSIETKMKNVDKNIKKNDAKILNDKIENKCENEYKSILLHATKMYAKLQNEWTKDYLNTFKYPKIIKKVDHVLNNMNLLHIDPNFQFEFALMYWGALVYVQEETKKIINHNTENDNAKLYIYVDVLKKLEDKYEKFGHNAFLNIEDSKQRVLMKCLLDNSKLFQVEKYRYEALLLKSGLRAGSKEILEELKKSVTWFTNDSKDVFNKVEENLRVLESTFVDKNVVQTMSILPEIHLVKQLNEDEKNVKKHDDECKAMVFYVTNRYEKFQMDWNQEYLYASADQNLITKIDYFLKHMDYITMNPDYQYEFVFIYWGAFNCGQEQTKKAVDDDIENDIVNFYSDAENQTKIKTFWKETGKNIYLEVLRNMKLKYDMLLDKAAQNIQDPMQSVLYKSFIINPVLFNEKNNKYEFLLFKRGHFQEGPKEISKEFNKRVELFLIDAKNKNE